VDQLEVVVFQVCEQDEVADTAIAAFRRTGPGAFDFRDSHRSGGQTVDRDDAILASTNIRKTVILQGILVPSSPIAGASGV
jgi:hypothetical protein